MGSRGSGGRGGLLHAYSQMGCGVIMRLCQTNKAFESPHCRPIRENCFSPVVLEIVP